MDTTPPTEATSPPPGTTHPQTEIVDPSRGARATSDWFPLLGAPAALSNALSGMNLPYFARAARPGAPALYGSADARKMRDRYMGFLMQEDIRACIRDAIGPVATIIYSEVYVYVWLACLYSVFLVCIASANLFVLHKLLREMRGVAAPAGGKVAVAEPRSGEANPTDRT